MASLFLIKDVIILIYVLNKESKMKVITIKQPYASLIKEGIKEYEFRTWKTKYRGEILIHAGKSIDRKAIKKFEKYNLDYPTGCIIAKANLTDCIKIGDEERKFLEKKNSLVYSNVINSHDWNGYAFKIENVKEIEPIYINGKLSLWEYDYHEYRK